MGVISKPRSGLLVRQILPPTRQIWRQKFKICSLSGTTLCPGQVDYMASAKAGLEHSNPFYPLLNRRKDCESIMTCLLSVIVFRSATRAMRIGYVFYATYLFLFRRASKLGHRVPVTLTRWKEDPSTVTVYRDNLRMRRCTVV